MKRHFRTYEYRYRDNAGSTDRSEKRAAKHLHKVGSTIQYVRGYQYRGKYNVRDVVLVRGIDKRRGTSGTARFDGFCWGYGGTGPHGLQAFLERLRIPQCLVLKIAFETDSPDFQEPRQYWRLECSEDCERYTLYLYDENNRITEATYWLGSKRLHVVKVAETPVCSCGRLLYAQLEQDDRTWDVPPRCEKCESQREPRAGYENYG